MLPASYSSVSTSSTTTAAVVASNGQPQGGDRTVRRRQRLDPGLSVMSLVISHDVVGMTRRLADNISANGVGLALRTVIRFIAYQHLVFRSASTLVPKRRSVSGARPRAGDLRPGLSLCSTPRSPTVAR
jgi:hypothetical protein